MDPTTAYCGLSCRTCPIRLATGIADREEQARRRAEIARLCREEYGLDYAPEDITDCDGCRSDGARLFKACEGCPIRSCARGRRLESCAACPEYACAQLETFFAGEPSARERLEAIRSGNP